MYNKGDSSYLEKPKAAPFSVIEKIPLMLESEYNRTTQKDFRIAFHGGEPLLVGKKYFIQMMDYLTNTLSAFVMKYSLQTNATLIDDEWLEILSHYKIAVAASIDGPATVNKNRIYRNGKSSINETVRGINLLKNSNVDFAGVICVIQPYSSGKDVVDFFVKQLQLEWFDFLLPDYTHDSLPSDWPEQQKSFLDFLITAFQEWYPYSSQNVSCRFFDNTIAGLLGYESLVDTIGREGLSSVIIETNGKLEPHDVFRICMGFDRDSQIYVGENALDEFYRSNPYLLALNTNKEFAEQCSQCEVFETCKGGHLTHRYSKGNSFYNPSVHCYTLKGFILFLQEFIGTKIQELSTISSIGLSK